MERLTYRGENGFEIKGADGTPCDEVCENRLLSGCHDCPIQMAFDRIAAYEDTGLEPEEVTELMAAHGTAILELSEYRSIGPAKHFLELAQAEKDGRLVVLPCKVGNTVYEINKRGFVSTYKVISIHISDCSILVGWELIDGIYSNLNGFEVSALGKTVFLTREEAEAALKKREEKGNA